MAALLAERGYATCLIARRGDRLDQVVRKLLPAAPSFAVVADLADPAARQEALERLLADRGVPDVVVNNAGYGRYGRFLDTPEAEHRRMMEVNYFAPAHVISLVLPGMRQRRSGHIVNVASISANFGPYGHAAYAASKAALVSLTQTLAIEHEREPIHFSYVKPGVVLTEFFENPSYEPLKRIVARHGISPEKLAQRIAGLLDRPRLELVYPGHYRLLDWCNALSPRLTQKLIAWGSRPAPVR